MKCLKCNFENPEGSVFCASCGNKIEIISTQAVQPVVQTISTAQNNNAEPPKKKNKTLLLILIPILLIGAVIGVLLMTKDNESKVDDNNSNEVMEENEDVKEPIVEVNSYQVGDEITLVDGSSWYYVSSDNDKVVLLSKSNYGEATYFCLDGKNMYETSHVKDVVENEYLPTIKTSILSAGGNVDSTTARVLSLDDIKKVINSSESDPSKIEIGYKYKWLFETGSYWLSTHSYDSLYNSAYLVQSWGSSAKINLDIAGLNMGWGNEFYVRPLLETSIDNIKK